MQAYLLFDGILFQPNGHTLSQRNHPILFEFDLPDVDRLSFKIDIGDLQINDLLAAKPNGHALKCIPNGLQGGKTGQLQEKCSFPAGLDPGF
jgi:hypothetical protein